MVSSPITQSRSASCAAKHAHSFACPVERLLALMNSWHHQCNDLGVATATHVRISDPFLRDGRLRALIPLRKLTCAVVGPLQSGNK